jgi:hypothetical protein
MSYQYNLAGAMTSETYPLNSRVVTTEYDNAGRIAGINNPTFYADLTDPQSLNKYQYCYNNPLIYVDLDDHQSLLERAKATTRYYTNLAIAQGQGVVEGAASVVSGTATFVWHAGSGNNAAVIEDIKGTFESAKQTIKDDVEVVTHPVEAAKAIGRAVNENPEQASRIIGRAEGQVGATIALGKAAKALGVEIEARGSILPRVEAAAKAGGNQPVGTTISGTKSGVLRAGEIWLGKVTRPIASRQGTSVPGAFNPTTGRAFRPPTAKNYGGTVANFQTRSPKANVHVNVKWIFF